MAALSYALLTASAMFLLTVSAAVLICGCGGQSVPKRSKDEELVLKFMRDFETAHACKDVDKLMELVSEGFRFEGGNKMHFREAVESSMNVGEQVSFAEAAIEVNEDQAAISPFHVFSKAETITLMLHLKKEGGRWLLAAAFAVMPDQEGQPMSGQEQPSLPVGGLPDVYDPNGAFEPVPESQY